MWNTFLGDNSTGMRLLRTIVQGIIGVIIANLDVIIGTFQIPPEMKAIIVGLVMSILSPIMAEIGKHTLNNEEIRIEPVEGDVGATIPNETDTTNLVG